MRTKTLYTQLFLLTLASGCGQRADERVPVAGKVLLNGQALSGGTIRFVPELGRPASSAILSDGSFNLASESVGGFAEKGIPPGHYRVQVSASKVLDDKTIHWDAPEKYADFRTSGLAITIEKPTSGLLINLTSDVAQSNQNSLDHGNDAKDASQNGAAALPQVHEVAKSAREASKL